MKEIDFLPEWYKNGRRRQVNYRLQYIIIVGVFAVMMVWNYVSVDSLATVRAKNMELETRQSQAEKVSAKLEEYKKEIAMLHKKEKVLDSMDSKIVVSNILAEISYLVDKSIVLERVDFISEKIHDQDSEGKTLLPASVVKSAGSGSSKNTNNYIGNICFKVVIAGVAANGSDVAALLCKLEDSPYFNHVDLSYLKDAQVKAAQRVLDRKTQVMVRLIFKAISIRKILFR